MSTHIAISYHIVFSTKNREPVLHQDRRKTRFQEEYRKLLVEAGIEFDERYLF